jgi:hypothetical protein
MQTPYGPFISVFQMFTLASAMRHKLGASMDFELVKKLMVTTRLHRQILNRVGVIVIALAVLVTASCLGIMSWLYYKTDAEQAEAELTKVELLLKNEQDGLGRAVRDYAVCGENIIHTHTKASNTATYFFALEIILNLLSVKYISLYVSLSTSWFNKIALPHQYLHLNLPP